MEYYGAGTADLRPAAIASADEEGDNVTDLLFDSYQVIEGKPDYSGLPHTYLNDGDGAQTLKITLRDKVKDLCVDLYYTVFDFSGAIARWTVIRNEGKQADGIFHGLNREPAVCGGAGQSLACRSLGLSFRVAGIVFHIADDLHQHGN